jgi:hypothetical protein
MTLIKDLPDGSSTQLLGLNLQVIHQVNTIIPNTLVDISDLNIIHGDGLFPFAHPKLKEALAGVLRVHSQAITINNAWRPITTQSFFYHLKETGRGMQNNLVAIPGRSDHEGGASIDIPEWDSLKTLFNSYWFQWTYGDRDPMHFDCMLVPNEEKQNIKQKTTLAFQQLWNKTGNSKLTEDGIPGNATLDAILNSPAEGFADFDPSPRFLKLTTPIQVGKDVGRVQLFLKKNGFNIVADQSFGNATNQAVRDFQKANNLEVDGVIGRKMWSVVNAIA